MREHDTRRFYSTLGAKVSQVQGYFTSFAANVFEIKKMKQLLFE